MAIDRVLKKDILKKIKAKEATVPEMSKEHGIPKDTIYVWMRKENIKVDNKLKYVPLKVTADVHTREIVDATKDQLIEKLLNNLDQKELQFVEFILSNRGYKKAYELVYGKPEKDSIVYAKLREPRIQKALIKLNSDLLAHFEIETVPSLIKDLNEMITFDWIDLLDEEQQLKNLNSVPIEARRNIRKLKKKVVKIQVGTDRNNNPVYEAHDEYEIEPYDKLKAIDQLAKIHKLYDNRNITINNTTVNAEGNELIKGLNNKYNKKPKFVNAKVVDN